jgi:N-acetylmuramoyl-L-alanine amidase
VRTCAKIRRPATLTVALTAILLTALSAHAGTLTRVKLRVSGKELALKTPAVFDGKEVYIPLEALQAFRAGYTVTRHEETAIVTPNGGSSFEIALARPGKLPMIPLSSLIKPLKVDFELEDDVCDVTAQGSKPGTEGERGRGRGGEREKGKPSNPASQHLNNSTPQRRADPVQPPQTLEQLPSRGGAAKQPGAATGRKPAGDEEPPADPDKSTGAAQQGDVTQGQTAPTTQQAPAPVTVKPAIGLIRIEGVAFEATDATHARLRIKTNGKAAAYAQLLHEPSRLAIDIPNSSVAPEESEWKVDHPFASGLHVSEGDKPNVTRVSLDLSKLISYRVLPAGPDGITVNLALPKGAGRKMSDLIVVVDPGHGGRDGVNPLGCQRTFNGQCVLEKSLTLSIARRVKRILEEMGATVIMTRTTDVNVSLKQRPAIATENNADLFVSIHIDDVNSSAPSGTTTYYHMDDSSSRALAHSIVEHVGKVSGLPNRRARSDGVLYGNGLAVLRYSTVPSTLVEVGFLSNPRDRVKLINSEFQETVAKAIARGIEGYIGSELPDEATTGAE